MKTSTTEPITRLAVGDFFRIVSGESKGPFAMVLEHVGGQTLCLNLSSCIHAYFYMYSSVHVLTLHPTASLDVWDEFDAL